MTVSNAAYLKGFYDTTRALGAKVISSDFTFEIEGFEGNYLLCKQAPWPELSPAGEIEVPTPLGATMWQPQQLKVAQQGQISMFETIAGSIDQMLVNLITRGGTYAPDSCLEPNDASAPCPARLPAAGRLPGDRH